jgi:probable HAF family extracellular repeat protein
LKGKNFHGFALFLGISLILCAPLVAQVEGIDLGTLGGLYSEAYAINEWGQVVGYSEKVDYGDNRAFVLVPADTNDDGEPDVWYLDEDSDGANDLMIDLGFDGYDYSDGFAINNQGQILMRVYDASIPGYLYFFVDPEDTDLDGKPDVWFKDEDSDGFNDLMHPIDTLGGDWIRAVAMNDLGQVVGKSETSEAGVFHAFLWELGRGTIDLGTLRGDESEAVDINNAGQIAGESYTHTGAKHAFLITPIDTDFDGIPDQWYRDDGYLGNGLMQDLHGLSHESYYSYVWDLNERGRVIGCYQVDADMHEKAFLWVPGAGMHDLGTLIGEWPSPVALNEYEEVVGYIKREMDSTTHGIPFYWTWESGLIDLSAEASSITEEVWNFCWDINNLGHMVGCTSVPNHPFKLHMAVKSKKRSYLYSPDEGMTELEAVYPDVPKSHAVVRDINDGGLVIGSTSVLLPNQTSTLIHAALWKTINTMPGDDVVVTPEDPDTGESPVTLIFEDVEEGGDTTLTITETGTPPPTGFKLGNPPQYFVIETTAEYSGSITICFDYSGISFGGREENLKLFYREEGGEWVQLEVTVYPEENRICCTVDHLSIFIISEPMTLNDLILEIQESMINVGIRINLTRILRNASNLLEEGNSTAARNLIIAFQKEVSKLSETKIPVYLADRWIEISNVILNIL